MYLAAPNKVYAQGACCTRDTQCDTTKNETCTGTSYICGRQGKKSCLRPAPTPTPPPPGQSVCPNDYPNEYCQSSKPSGIACISKGKCYGGGSSGPFKFCCKDKPPVDYYDKSTQKVCDLAGDNKTTCEGCVSQGGAWTAIGCIPTEPKAFIQKFITFGAGLAGGIAFLLILLGGFQVMTSTGNPEKLNAGKELVVSALTGLILIIFSILLLKIIGYNILGIPGFG